MDLRDLFVASVAMVLGGMMLHAAIIDQGWCFQMKVSRMIAEASGRARARGFIGTVGAVLILIGLYIVFAPIVLLSVLQSEGREPARQSDNSVIILAETD